MSFDAAKYLRGATGRAKSDVANKLISMFLHDLSKRICKELKVNISDINYLENIQNSFAGRCCYCDGILEADRVATEHPDGMNRFRAGLHITGNVLVSCKKCNNAKRLDDQKPTLVLAPTGWESFLSHDSKRCEKACKTCLYWTSRFSEAGEKDNQLASAKLKITNFRMKYAKPLAINQKIRSIIISRLDSVYRECQEFAADRIQIATTEVLLELKSS